MRDAVGRIGLLGGECTGKTSLANALAVVLPGCVVPEELRAFVDEHGRAPNWWEQRGIMLAQFLAEDALVHRCTHDVVIADPAPLMTAIYHQAYFDDASMLDEAVALSSQYDLILWCDIDVPWEPDGAQRDGPTFRQREHDLIAAAVRDRLVPSGLTVVRVGGSLEERTEAARRAWQLLAPSAPT